MNRRNLIMALAKYLEDNMEMWEERNRDRWTPFVPSPPEKAELTALLLSPMTMMNTGEMSAPSRH